MESFSSRYLDDAHTAWLSSLTCCGEALKEQAPMRGDERHMRIEHHQPCLVPPPIPEPQERPLTRGREWSELTKSFASRASTRGSFAVRRTCNAYNGPRRRRNPIVISGPTDFRHVGSAISRRKEVFRPLELSIYMPENQLSPILPHFGAAEFSSFELDDLMDLTYPPTVFAHLRSESAQSFRVPRKPLRSSPRASSEWAAHFKPRPDSLSAKDLLAALESELPKAPAPARLRAWTEPPAYERVKSALHEKLELDRRLKDIDEQIEERRSIYISSRPSSRTVSFRPASVTSIYGDAREPMPKPTAIAPQLPFAAAATLPHVDQRPKTAPARTAHIASRLKSFTEASAAFTTPPQTPSPLPTPSEFENPVLDFDLPPPPLPLVLQAPRTPLQKRKSFSRVTSWLFPEHARNISSESITNMPKPVTTRDGFYQCVELAQSAHIRTSVDSVSSVGTLATEVNAPTTTAPTWTPQSSPGGAGKRDFTLSTRSLSEGRDEESIELRRMRNSGEEERLKDGHNMESKPVQEHNGRNSVGVAF